MISYTETTAPRAVPRAGLTPPDLSGFGLTNPLWWHPHTETVTLSGSEITGVAAKAGVPPMTSAAGYYPVLSADPLGRATWQFRDGDYLLVDKDAASVLYRNYTAFIVGRFPKNNGTGRQHLLTAAWNPTKTAYTTTPNLLTLIGAGTNAGFAYPNVTNVSTWADLANRKWMPPGNNLTVLGCTSRDTAGGGQRVFNNGWKSSIAQSTIVADIAVARHGLCWGNQMTSLTNLTNFEAYYLLYVPHALTNAQFDALGQALMDHWGLVAFDTNFIFEGASNVQGFGAVPRVENLTMKLTDPGRYLLPPNMRVLNYGTAGATYAEYVARRESVDGLAAVLLPGGPDKNIYTAGLGHNLLNTGSTPLQVRNIAVEHIATAATSVLSQGYRVAWQAEIGSSNQTYAAQMAEYYGHLKDPSFVTDCLAGPGGIYAGRLSLVDLTGISIGGVRPFDGTVSAAGSPFFQPADPLHKSEEGLLLWATGGETPANGYGAVR